MDMNGSVSVDSPDSQLRGSTNSPEILHSAGHRAGSDPLMDMLLSGWDPDLPDRETLNH